jgi:NADPH-dependent 7-cyano-7-deazaguanine reductase QueF
MKSYSQTGLKEIFRKFFRGVDFLILSLKVNLYPSKKGGRLVEFGAGPMRLLGIKKMVFKEVCNIDHRYYFQSDENSPYFLKEDINNLDKIKRYLTTFKNENVTIFADHCFEHISHKTFDDLIDFFIKLNFRVIFRVPNVHSSQGKKNYESDNTHQIPFEDNVRESLISKGFKVRTWNRWYKIDLFITKIITRQSRDSVFCEILCYRESGDY